MMYRKPFRKLVLLILVLLVAITTVSLVFAQVSVSASEEARDITDKEAMERERRFYERNLMPVRTIREYYLEPALGTPAYGQLLKAIASLEALEVGKHISGAAIPTLGDLEIIRLYYLEPARGTPAYDAISQALEVMEQAHEHGTYDW